MKYSGVLLDLDNTLYDYEAAHRPALAAALARAGELAGADTRRTGEAFAVARAEINGALAGTAASHNRLLYFQRMFELLQVNPLGHALDVYHCYWDAFLERMVFDEGTEAFLDALAGAPVCLVSDLTAHIQYRKIEKLGLARWVRHLVTSEEAGREKPHADVFRLALGKLGLPASAVCMVGDSFSKDILGAANLGIPSFWLNRSGEIQPLPASAREVKGLHEIIGHLS